MSTLLDNLNSIYSIKNDIKSVLEDKGVDMTNYSFPDYPSVISSLSGGGVYSTLSVSENGTYYPETGYDGFSEVSVNVIPNLGYDYVFSSNGFYKPEDYGYDGFAKIGVDVPGGYTEKEVTEGVKPSNISNSASYVNQYAFLGNTNLQTVSLPNCTMVNQGAFSSCTSLTTAYLPNCSSIGSSAFYYCKKLTDINIQTCELVGQQAFAYCSSLSQVILPMCSIISQSAFSACVNLNSLTLCTDVYWTIPYQSRMLSNTPIMSGTGSIYVRSDTYSAWITSTGWSSLSDRFVSVETTGYLLSFSEGTLYGSTYVLYSSFNNFIEVSKNDIVSVSLPNCNKIGGYVFRDCTSLSNVYLPECNVIDGVNPFYGLVSIQTMNIGFDYLSNKDTNIIPSSLKQLELPRCSYIGKSVFEQYSLLSQVSLPVCEFISDYAFYYCSSLESVVLPICSHISAGAFLGCSSLSYISIPECQIIETGAFMMCSGLTNVNLPKCISISNNGFSSCTSLSQVSIPLCEYIGSSCFNNTSLESVDLPVCSYIGDRAFYVNNSLILTLRYSDVVTAGGTQIINNTATVYVPASLVDAYKSAPSWSVYSNRIFPISE